MEKQEVTYKRIRRGNKYPYFLRSSKFDLQLEGKTIVVTGAGGGIGSAIVRALLGQRAHVIGVDIKPIEKSELASQKHNRNLTYIEGDAANESQMRAALSPFNRIHGLVNCAGLLGGDNDVKGGKSVENLLMMFNAHAVSTFIMTNLAAEKMSEGDSVVDIGSIETHQPAANVSMYVAAQNAKEGLTKANAITLGLLGIRVNMVKPGFTATKANLNRYQEMGEESEAELRGLWSRTLLDFVTPLQIANFVLYLLSNLSENLTGQIISYDGGNTLPLLPDFKKKFGGFGSTSAQREKT